MPEEMNERSDTIGLLLHTSADGSGELMDLPYILTPQEAARTAKVSRDLIYDLCRQNLIPHRKLGSQIRVHRDGFLTWLAGQDKSPSDLRSK